MFLNADGRLTETGQTVPDNGSGDWEGPAADGRQLHGRYQQTIGPSRGLGYGHERGRVMNYVLDGAPGPDPAGKRAFSRGGGGRPEDGLNPTQPGRWMDRTHVHLWDARFDAASRQSSVTACCCDARLQRSTVRRSG